MTARDTTARHDSGPATEQRIQPTLDVAPDAMIGVDRDGSIVQANAQSAEGATRSFTLDEAP